MISRQQSGRSSWKAIAIVAVLLLGICGTLFHHHESASDSDGCTYTHSYDFNVLLNTTITFPIAWHNSSTTNLHGFQAYWTFGHTRARYFPPENGGLIFQGKPLAGGVFRIDRDQAFQSTMNLRYQRRNAEWIAFTYRYDSGFVLSGHLQRHALPSASNSGSSPRTRLLTYG